MSATQPARYGPYEPDRILATGSQAQVWLANGPMGEVALKIARAEKDRASLAREADVLARAGHPGLVKVLDRAQDGSWVAMERIRGTLIDQWAASRDYAEVLRVGRAVLSTVDYLHGLGIVHGDIKPSNVLVDADGAPRVLDLGIATLDTEEQTEFRGTLGYAAPEVLQGSRPTPRSDYYGFGALLYRCFTGRAPFVAPDPAALTYLPLVSLPLPASSFDIAMPRVLDRLLLMLLARDPQRRPRTVKQIDDLLRKAVGKPPGAPVLGMYDLRDELRRAAIGASDREGRVVVLYGPPGSGRRTLISEVVEAARREGLVYLKASQARQAHQMTHESDDTPVLVLRSSARGVRKLATSWLEDGLRGLLLIHADRPMPDLPKAAIQRTPPPLTARDAERLCQHLGAEAARAEGWWRESGGHPIALIGRIRAHLRRERGEALDWDHLPAESQKILRYLDEPGEPTIAVAELARELGMGEHDVLDHAEVLFAENLVEASTDGRALRRCEEEPA